MKRTSSFSKFFQLRYQAYITNARHFPLRLIPSEPDHPMSSTHGPIHECAYKNTISPEKNGLHNFSDGKPRLETYAGAPRVTH